MVKNRSIYQSKQKEITMNKKLLFLTLAAGVAFTGVTTSWSVSVRDLLNQGKVLEVKNGELFLNDMDITSFDGLADVPGIENLQELIAYSNKLTSVEGIPQWLPLTLLFLNDNQLKNLKGIQQFTKLQTLYAAHNPLIDLQGIPQQLQELSLEKNNLTNLPGIPRELPCLEIFDLNHNKLSNLTDMPKLPKLKHLFLQHNPLSPKAKQQIKKRLPKAQISL